MLLPPLPPAQWSGKTLREPPPSKQKEIRVCAHGHPRGSRCCSSKCGQLGPGPTGVRDSGVLNGFLRPKQHRGDGHRPEKSEAQTEAPFNSPVRTVGHPHSRSRSKQLQRAVTMAHRPLPDSMERRRNPSIVLPRGPDHGSSMSCPEHRSRSRSAPCSSPTSVSKRTSVWSTSPRRAPDDVGAVTAVSLRDNRSPCKGSGSRGHVWGSPLRPVLLTRRSDTQRVSPGARAILSVLVIKLRQTMSAES